MAEVLPQALARLQEALGGALFGQEEAIEALLATVLARGHALLEGVPGLGKTLLAESFAQGSGLSYKRIQFTPDLLPQDLTGSEVFREGRFEFLRGPLFAQVVLADEVNRAPPKVQSALLEAMQERAVTAGGVRHPLPEPFFVVATQNPLELEGTYPLPEAQLDRFTAKIPFRPPRREVWLRILTEEPKVPEPQGVDFLRAQAEAREVRVAKEALEAITHVAFLTGEDGRLRMGLSPRGAKAWLALARALAYLRGKPLVDWKELKDAAFLALPHRLFLTEEALYEGETAEGVLREVLRKGGVP
ncbi:AAA family ATPase [Thermus thermamylovorans]|uniref:AAA family ATPase n=1 Tax=Thermus thermamylovorans TaxID=2509362 RepID=A0A4V2IUQ5_9DEIN|nr:AAA family ATPase [Thermus thermamylovorans]TBH17646.1 AAA family ATPase [Thermus thermamylovorans]